jgi:arylsulfatase A-like enzyme
LAPCAGDYLKDRLHLSKRIRINPFFCYVTHNSIHDPEIEKKSLIEKYAKKPELKKLKTNNPKQAAMLETLDKSIGTILDTLEELDWKIIRWWFLIQIMDKRVVRRVSPSEVPKGIFTKPVFVCR